MAERVARERVKGEEDYVGEHDEGAEADAELTVEEKREVSVMPQEAEEDERGIEKVAMDILQDERKFGFAAVFAAGGFIDGTSRGIEKECTVVGFAVVVAGGAEAEWEDEDKKRGGELPPLVVGVDERGIEGREVRSPFVVLALEGAQGGVDAETAEEDPYGNEFGPPGVAAESAAETRLGQWSGRASHELPLNGVAYAKTGSFEMKLFRTKKFYLGFARATGRKADSSRAFGAFGMTRYGSVGTRITFAAGEDLENTAANPTFTG
jgi:hypothetical protein